MAATTELQLPVWARIALWMVLGTSLILFNKTLLTTWGFSKPFFLTTWHMLFATLMTQILARTTSLLPAVASGRVSWHDYWTKIVPPGIFFATGLVLGNMAYGYISLAFIQMIKSFTPVPALLLTFVTGRQEPSLPLLGIVVVISGGVVLSTVGEMHFRLVGFIIQMSAVFSDCLRMVYTEAVLKDLNLDTLSMLYYHAPTCAVIIGVGFLIFEAPSFDVGLFTPALCVLLLLNAMLAFSLNFAALYLMSGSSTVVVSVSGPLKDILIVCLSVLIFHTPVTITQVVGFSISLTGLFIFSRFKQDPKGVSRVC
eukprot:CAMPEP_0173250712 /NCGR_PEP_ID=MMETSP1142-20121109/19735_1 /TAXON_ID=483371 /ORGANISM="non described non described, Strain CCMP2298" /LENGTH=311 /DNA_ID=CAMNT_0014183497 /DNA_START=33 /DNA_END=965 /DNA_ORIENTATION=-